jgi:hypothetical protein
MVQDVREDHIRHLAQIAKKVLPIRIDLADHTRRIPMPTTRQARRPRTAKKTARKATTTMNHKTPEAQARRDKLDQDVGALLLQKKHAEGLGKVDIATELGADASAVKASCNRLIRADILETSGTTMNTVYKALPGAETKLKALGTKTAKAAPSKAAPAKTKAKRISPRRHASAGA